MEVLLVDNGRNYGSSARYSERRSRCDYNGTEDPGQFVGGGHEQEAPQAAHANTLA